MHTSSLSNLHSGPTKPYTPNTWERLKEIKINTPHHLTDHVTECHHTDHPTSLPPHQPPHRPPHRPSPHRPLHCGIIDYLPDHHFTDNLTDHHRTDHLTTESRSEAKRSRVSTHLVRIPMVQAFGEHCVVEVKVGSCCVRYLSEQTLAKLIGMPFELPELLQLAAQHALDRTPHRTPHWKADRRPLLMTSLLQMTPLLRRCRCPHCCAAADDLIAAPQLDSERIFLCRRLSNASGCMCACLRFVAIMTQRDSSDE